jgi:hypothetical protein
MTKNEVTLKNLIPGRPFLLWTLAADLEASALHTQIAFWPVPLGFTFVLLNESHFMYILGGSERGKTSKGKRA